MDDDMANLLVAQLLYLDAADKKKDITMYVNSPGGSVTAGGFPTRAAVLNSFSVWEFPGTLGEKATVLNSVWEFPGTLDEKAWHRTCRCLPFWDVPCSRLCYLRHPI